MFVARITFVAKTFVTHIMFVANMFVARIMFVAYYVGRIIRLVAIITLVAVHVCRCTGTCCIVSMNSYLSGYKYDVVIVYGRICTIYS